MVMAETFVTALLAAALSLAPGLAFGRLMYHVLVGQGLIPGVMVFSQGFIPQLAGFGSTLLAALAAAFIASRRVSKVRPTEAMAEATLQTRWVSPIRMILAFLFLGGAGALAIVTALVMTGPIAASTSAPAAMLWAVGIALVCPGLCRCCGRTADAGGLVDRAVGAHRDAERVRAQVRRLLRSSRSCWRAGWPQP